MNLTITLCPLITIDEKQIANIIEFQNTFNHRSLYFTSFKNEQQSAVKEDL